MPIYEYRARDESSACDCCRQPFEVIHAAGEPPLEKCPGCSGPLARLISAPAKPRQSILSRQNIERHGFVQYKKAGGGRYEKTAGIEGPNVLRRPE